MHAACMFWLLHPFSGQVALFACAHTNAAPARQVMPMLLQLAQPPGSEAGGWPNSVAILADRPKKQMDELLQRDLFDKGYT